MKLKGKVALISDADDGLGQVLAKAFASEGASLILQSDSGGAAIAGTVEALNGMGASVHVIRADAADSASVEPALAEAEKKIGTVDILLHNHNRIIPSSVADCDEELFYQLLDANAKTAFVLTKAAGRRMVAKGRGWIVYVSSIHDEKPTGFSIGYSMAKGAVQMLMKEAVLELGRKGVNINTIEVGPLEETKHLFHSDMTRLFEHVERKIPSDIGTYRDIANIALFLSSEESRYMNGDSVRADGGFVLHYFDSKMKPAPQGGDSE